MRPKYVVEDIELNTHNISIVEDEFTLNFLESEIYYGTKVFELYFLHCILTNSSYGSSGFSNSQGISRSTQFIYLGRSSPACSIIAHLLATGRLTNCSLYYKVLR